MDKFNKRKFPFEEQDSFKAAVAQMEARLGGAKIVDLMDGDPVATEIAERAMRKEVMKLMTQDIERERKR